MKPNDFFSFAKKSKAEMVDLKFVDMLGTWQHCSFPIELWDEDTFSEGLGFDGSSIRGWMGIHESDMLAVPDPATVCLDPFFQQPTVSVIADIVDPVSGEMPFDEVPAQRIPPLSGWLGLERAMGLVSWERTRLTVNWAFEQDRLSPQDLGDLERGGAEDRGELHRRVRRVVAMLRPGRPVQPDRR